MHRYHKGFWSAIIAILVLAILLFQSGAILGAQGGQRIPTYSVSSSPQTMNLNNSVTITVSIQGGKAYTPYGFTVTVTKPDSISTAAATRFTITNMAGDGWARLSYPSDFRVGTAAPGGNQSGVYEVRIDQIAPWATYGVASGAFEVSSSLIVNVISPTLGQSMVRGSDLILSVRIFDINGNLDSNVSAYAFVAFESRNISLLRDSEPGVFSASYLTNWQTPVGSTTIVFFASDDAGDGGVASVSVTLLQTYLVVHQLNSFGSSGQIRSSYYNNETVFFQIDASYPNGSRISTGAASIQIADSSGNLVATLAAVYDIQSDRLTTITGYNLNGSTAFGQWAATVLTNGMDDGYGNTGPTLALTVHFQVLDAPTPTTTTTNGQPSQGLGPISIPQVEQLVPAVLSGLGIMVPAIAWKSKSRKADKTSVSRIVRLGAAAGFTLVEGDPRTGKSDLIYEILGHHIQAKQAAILLTFEIPIHEAQARLTSSGLDPDYLESSGLLRIIDGSNLPQALNLDYLRREMVQSLAPLTGRVTLFVDSLNLLFEDLENSDVETFLEGLVEEVTSRNGSVYATITYNGYPQSLIDSLEEMAGLVIVTERPSSSGLSSSRFHVKKSMDTNLGSKGAGGRIRTYIQTSESMADE